MSDEELICDEDYADQNREIKINRAVEAALDTVDQIIFKTTDGSVEETDYLTARIAEKLMMKVTGRVGSTYLAHRLKERFKEKK